MKSIKNFENKKVNLAESNIAAGRKRTGNGSDPNKDWLHRDNSMTTRDGFLGLGNDKFNNYQQLP